MMANLAWIILFAAAAAALKTKETRSAKEAEIQAKLVQDRAKEPQVYSGKYQGDIDVSQMKIDVEAGSFRNGIKYKQMRWPNGIVPYRLHGYGPEHEQIITTAFADLERQVNALGYCISLTPQRDEANYVLIMPGNGCFSPVGMVGGQQMASLGWTCLQNGIVQHEMLHTFGFWHEMSRPDRDQYIDVHWENMDPRAASNFRIETQNMDLLGTRYDYASIMHYGATAASMNGYPTMVPRDPNAKIGLLDLSPTDIQRVRTLYDCQPYTGDSSAVCVDRSPHCKDWADIGGCEQNPSYMLESCQKACGVC
ncbi:zinc metalloproteinase nas-6-like [Tubulanus polymorphus]|uniref:zinc metalloproteinase nas-6-like n=1 Tax=Tubulanus polymorphus TaxID=672921 RepID=UPI003DA433BC